MYGAIDPRSYVWWVLGFGKKTAYDTWPIRGHRAWRIPSGTTAGGCSDDEEGNGIQCEHVGGKEVVLGNAREDGARRAAVSIVGR
jgi:hypothetical protein